MEGDITNFRNLPNFNRNVSGLELKSKLRIKRHDKVKRQTPKRKFPHV